jgi:DNA gyrase/topoisomerase IV subunit B
VLTLGPVASDDETDIELLSPIQSIRRRPGMYFGDPECRGLHGWARYGLEGASDGVCAGRGSAVTVQLHVDGSCEIEDDTPELPGLSAGDGATPSERLERASLEFVVGRYPNHLTLLRAAGARLEILVRHRAEDLALVYVDQELVSRSRADLHDTEPLDHEGMRVRFWPDPVIFSHRRFDAGLLAEWVESIAGFQPGVRASLEDHRSGRRWTFEYPRGLLDWLDAMTPDSIPREPIHFIGERGGWKIEAAFRFQRSVAPSRLRVWSEATQTSHGVDDARVHAMLRAWGIRGWAPVGVILVQPFGVLNGPRESFVADALDSALHQRIETDPKSLGRLFDP